MIVSLFVFAPVAKVLYPAWYMTGHIASTALMSGALS